MLQGSETKQPTTFPAGATCQPSTCQLSLEKRSKERATLQLDSDTGNPTPVRFIHLGHGKSTPVVPIHPTKKRA